VYLWQNPRIFPVFLLVCHLAGSRIWCIVKTTGLSVVLKSSWITRQGVCCWLDGLCMTVFHPSTYSDTMS
jgi:hypothetical protein